MVIGPKGSYQLTGEDIFWWTLAAEKESSSLRGRDAAAFCMLQRFMKWPGDRWTTFAELIRAFSQPVNPIWANENSPKCKANPSYCTPRLVERRKKIQASRWEDIDPDHRNRMLAILLGQVENPVPWAVDFASRELVKSQNRTGVTIGGNTFLSAAQARGSWLTGVVQITPIDERQKSVLIAQAALINASDDQENLGDPTTPTVIAQNSTPPESTEKSQSGPLPRRWTPKKYAIAASTIAVGAAIVAALDRCS